MKTIALTEETVPRLVHSNVPSVVAASRPQSSAFTIRRPAVDGVVRSESATGASEADVVPTEPIVGDDRTWRGAMVGLTLSPRAPQDAILRYDDSRSRNFSTAAFALLGEKRSAHQKPASALA